MKIAFLLIAGLGVSLVLWSGPAICAGEAAANESVFEKADTNKDGKVTPAELAARRIVWFKELDTGKEGKVTPDKFRVGVFEQMDRNKDGVIERQEFIEFFAGRGHEHLKTAPSVLPAHEKGIPTHADLDRNKNGYADSKDYAEHYNGNFETADTNKDGKLDVKEFEIWRMKLYKEIDKNGRGYIVVEDMVVPVPVNDKAAENVKK